MTNQTPRYPFYFIIFRNYILLSVDILLSYRLFQPEVNDFFCLSRFLLPRKVIKRDAVIYFSRGSFNIVKYEGSGEMNKNCR